jgi:amino acid adenylation domain-containing protein
MIVKDHALSIKDTSSAKNRNLYSGIPSESQYQEAIKKCVHEIFDKIAIENPDAPALVCGKQILSYGDLRAKARSLSALISEKGLEHETVIGIYMGRSIEFIVSILAVLYSGGAYLPLDPLLPDDRIHFMINDCQSPMLITDTREYHRAVNFCDKVIMLDEKSVTPTSAGDIIKDKRMSPESLIYVMYTSGSTGTPKGVEIMHKGIVRLAYGDYANFGPGETFLHIASPSFDSATFEIWSALLHGSKLVLISERIPSIADIKRTISENEVTTALFTASYFNAIIDESPQTFSGLKQLYVVGEALSVPHIRASYAALPDTQIINGYGPTENSVGTTMYQIPRDLHNVTTSIPIGKPYRSVTAYILDEEGNPVPEGSPGELYSGGIGVGRGYRGREDLTRAKFLPDTFSNVHGAKMYRTGDIVKKRPDGLMEFIGRVDEQVKIQGFRVEPNEIQVVIKEHLSVRDALVIPQVDFAGYKHLVAYIVPTEMTSYNEEMIRQFIDQKLPEFMRPTFYIQMDSIPLKVNGKADKDALPSPWGLDNKLNEDDYANELELTIARLWFGVLGATVIAPKVNVFEYGAKSIHALRVHQRLQAVLNKKIPITAIFEYPTISMLAAFLKQDSSLESVALQDARTRAQKQAQSMARMKSRMQR